jgi:hypothetical protein
MKGYNGMIHMMPARVSGKRANITKTLIALTDARVL